MKISKMDMSPMLNAYPDSVEKQKNIKKDLQKEKLWMIFFRKLLQLSVKLQNVCLAWSITGYSSSVVSFFIRDVSQR